jgi:hypothetical protein
MQTSMTRSRCKPLNRLRPILTGITLAAALASLEPAAAKLYQFKDVEYTYTTSNGDKVKTHEGFIEGSFQYNGSDGEAGNFENVSIYFESADYIESSDQNGPQKEFTYTAGGSQGRTGKNQILFFYDPASGDENSSTRGVSLSMKGILGTDEPLVFADTANNQFCNEIGINIEDKARYGKCTSQKNNLTAISGTLNDPPEGVPSPGVMLGLLPLLGVGWRRLRSRRPGSAVADAAGGLDAVA